LRELQPPSRESFSLPSLTLQLLAHDPVGSNHLKACFLRIKVYCARPGQPEVSCTFAFSLQHSLGYQGSSHAFTSATAVHAERPKTLAVNLTVPGDLITSFSNDDIAWIHTFPDPTPDNVCPVPGKLR